ncbi:MAG: hypothetical protein L0Z53_06640 [Acidobacteriales bacterium]|nr:hypothetical protein [Terriglobales bacterium]
MAKRNKKSKLPRRLTHAESEALGRAGIQELRRLYDASVHARAWAGGEALKKLKARGLVRGRGEYVYALTTERAKRMALRRAGRALMEQEWQAVQDGKRDKLYDAMYKASGDGDSYEMPSWMGEKGLTEEEVGAKAVELHKAMLALRAQENEPRPHFKLRDAEVWVVQKRLSGELEELL